MFDTTELVLNMGPQHPSTHGVLRVVLRLDGERVVGSDVVIGYLHRGIEKLCEHRDWAQIVLLTDRMDYVAAASNNLGYCETVEKLMSLEVPRRARYIRTILAELQRIASHCLWLGTHAMDLGAMTVFLYAFRERELVLDLFEEYCGARLTYNAMRIGGLPLDIPAGLGPQGPRVLPTLRAEGCRVRRAPDAESDLAEPDARHRHHQRRRSDCDWADRAGAAGIGAFRGTCARTEPYAAYDGVRVRGADRLDRRHLRSLSRSDGGVPSVDPDHPPGARRLARGPGHRPGAAADQAARRRDLPRDRVAEGGARLLHRQRRQVERTVPVPRAAAVFLQSPGAPAPDPGASRLGRGRAHRIARHRASARWIADGGLRHCRCSRSSSCSTPCSCR